MHAILHHLSISFGFVYAILQLLRMTNIFKQRGTSRIKKLDWQEMYYSGASARHELALKSTGRRIEMKCFGFKILRAVTVETRRGPIFRM